MKQIKAKTSKAITFKIVTRDSVPIPIRNSENIFHTFVLSFILMRLRQKAAKWRQKEKKLRTYIFLLAE